MCLVVDDLVEALVNVVPIFNLICFYIFAMLLFQNLASYLNLLFMV